MKPGKSNYLVVQKSENKVLDVFMKMNNDRDRNSAATNTFKTAQLYVHSMISPIRQEEIYQSKDPNPRHLRDPVRPVHYFREWKEDTLDTTTAMFKHDWEHMGISKVIEDPIEL